NAVLLLAILPFLRGLARDPGVMGAYRISRTSSAATAIVIALVAISVAALAVLTILRMGYPFRSGSVYSLGFAATAGGLREPRRRDLDVMEASLAGRSPLGWRSGC